MADAGVGTVAATVGRKVLELVAAKEVGEYVKDMSKSYDERLSARLASAGDRDMTDTLVGFAQEIANLARAAPGRAEPPLASCRRGHQ